MKKLIQFFVLLIGLTLYACGGGNANSNNASSHESSEAIDVNEPSDSKGIGAFKDVSLPEQINEDMAAKGKEIFQVKCMVCHQVGTQRIIGPGLKNITKIRTPEWILNMITNPDQMLQEDPVAKALLKEFNGTRMTDQGITKEEAKQILAFLRQNDS